MQLNNPVTRVMCFLLVMAATGCTATNEASGGRPKQAADGGAHEADGGAAHATRTLDRSLPADGWRWESSLGVEVAIPDDWKINDTDCNQTDAPSVVRGQGAVLDCLTAEPLTKQIVEIADERAARDVPRPLELSYRDVMIGDVPAVRGDGKKLDGRAAGWLHLPSIGVIVDVRVKDDETLQMILDSVRVVDTDHNACSTARKDMSALAPKAETLAPTHARAVSVCYFDKANVLQASTLIEGVDAERVVDALNGTRPGRNLDVPESSCLHERELPPPDAVVIVHGDEDYAQIELTFSGCTHRGFSNGRSEAQLDRPLLEAIMKPLACGYGFSPYGLTPFDD